LQGHVIFCGGHDYEFQRRGDLGPTAHPSDGVFVDAGLSFDSELGAVHLGSSAPRGYHALQKAVNNRLPDATRIAQHARLAARRHLRNRRRRG
jgi:hypothetical protein